MKSAVFHGKHDIRVENLPMPEVGANEVLIKVRACGVCGTDVHIYEGHRGSADAKIPVVLGHEFAGEIVELGEDVSGLAVGDRVCIDPNFMCGSCYYCKKGIGHFCLNMTGYGVTTNGGFAEYCSVNKNVVFKLGDDTSFAQGAMAEPVACALHGLNMCNIQPGCTVAVIGGGQIGLTMVQLAKLAGAAKVILVEPVEEKRNLGKALGASVLIDPVKSDAKQAIIDAGIDRVEVVIECVGMAKTMEQALDICGKKSVCMMFGLCGPDDVIPLKPYEVFTKEVEIKASYINPYTMQSALDLINEKRIDITFMQCEPLPLERLVDAVSDMELRKKGKLIIDPTL